MSKLNFPIFSTKIPTLNQSFDLNDLQSRKKYFQAKASRELTIIKKYLAKKNFIAFMVGKKNSGKGTYSKLLAEALESDRLIHLSVGDLVREVSANWKSFEKSQQYSRLKQFYRGYISFDETIRRLLSRSTASLLPTEFILALLKVKFEELEGRSVFLDGFPREDDQISYSMFLKDLVNRKEDKDMFVLIDIPNSVIDERIKFRVVCPICNTPRSTKILITKFVGFDQDQNEFYLMCDNPSCNKARMLPKEGDNLGITPIKDRLKKDEQIIQKVYKLEGIDKILLRNSVPIKVALKNYDSYEITPSTSFKLTKDGEIETIDSPWIVKDDLEVSSYSLLAAPVALSLIKQLAAKLQL